MERNGSIARHKMKTFRCNLRPVRLVIFMCQLDLILRTEAQVPGRCIGHETYRPPEPKDITVICGTEYIDLIILLCPVYRALHNESLMVINNKYNIAECYGIADWTADPPVLKFRIYLDKSSITSCHSIQKIIDHIGSGVFSDFSKVQRVSISGTINSVDASTGMISYRQPVLYKFSCSYPMQYLLDNTKVGVSVVQVAIRDNNGTFISTLSMHLYKDDLFQEKLIIPNTGLPLRTKIFVAVEAANLTDRLNVLLDRCYTTTSQDPTQTTYYDLFVGCTHDAQTKVFHNGMSQTAYFYFEAFRFVEHSRQAVSIFYLHCITRLCEVSHCSSLLPNCSFHHHHHLSKREVPSVSNSTTITSPTILIHKPSDDVTDGLSTTDEPYTYYADTDMHYYHYTEDGHKEKRDPPNFSLLGGSPTSSLSCYSIPVVAAIICNVMLTAGLSV